MGEANGPAAMAKIQLGDMVCLQKKPRSNFVFLHSVGRLAFDVRLDSTPPRSAMRSRAKVCWPGPVIKDWLERVRVVCVGRACARWL